MKNQNSISKPTVITKPPSSKKDKGSIENKMDAENYAQQFDQKQDFQTNNTELSATPLTEQVDNQFFSCLDQSFGLLR